MIQRIEPPSIPVGAKVALAQRLKINYKSYPIGLRGKVVGHTADGNLMVEFEDLSLVPYQVSIAPFTVEMISDVSNA